MPVTGDGLTREDLQLATRNHGMPLEALRYDITPAGLHYLLTHFDIPEIDPADWRLEIDGAVGAPFSLGLDDLREMTPVTMPVVMECAGNGRARLHPRPLGQPWLFEAVSQAEWTGPRLVEVLDRAGVDRDAVEIVFSGADGGRDGGIEQVYQRSLPVDEARREDLILAHSMNGQPLLPQHGAPLRLVVPGWYGMAHVKWITGVTAVTTRFDGYMQDRKYRIRLEESEPGEPVTRILPRSLMVPPGIPDFLSGNRVVDAGPVLLAGRAWSGLGPVVSVEVTVDDGDSWQPASIDEARGPHAWQRWAYQWDAVPGETVLSTRATDETGLTQPDQPLWNLGGYQVNAIQRVSVEVRD